MGKRVYLAGPVIGLNYKDCTDWREYAKKELAKSDIIGVSPMRFKDYLKNRGVLLDADDTALESQKGITTRARNDVLNCHVFLANLLGAKRISIGTILEYGWADAYRKPIITIIEKEGNLLYHPIIKDIY